MSASIFRSALLALALGAACEHPSILLTVSREAAPERNPRLYVCTSTATCADFDHSFSGSETERTFGLFGGDGSIWIKLRDDGGTGVSGPCVRLDDAPNEKVRVELLADDMFTATGFPAEPGAVETCQ